MEQLVEEEAALRRRVRQHEARCGDGRDPLEHEPSGPAICIRLTECAGAHHAGDHGRLAQTKHHVRRHAIHAVLGVDSDL
eukprot:5767857-Prymnesium_polylepis.2